MHQTKKLGKNKPRRAQTLSDLLDEMPNSQGNSTSKSRRSGSQEDLSRCGGFSIFDNSKGKVSRKIIEGQGLYEGGLVNGLRQGQGRLLSEDGRRVVYEGHWIDDMPDGFGQKHFVNGDQHHGDYQRGQRHGWGVYAYACGDRYVGEWVAGLMEGRGKFVWATGDWYEGQMVAGHITGQGCKHQKDGSIITGSFKDGRAHGQCHKIYSCGDSYIGEYINDRRHGRGMYTWSDGCTYDGEWRCDMMSGHGEKAVRAPVAGSVKEQRRAQLVAVAEDGDPVASYKGEFLSGSRWGRGTGLFWDGHLYQGEWRRDACEGWGRCLYTGAGLVYEGEFRQGRREGQGQLAFRSKLAQLESVLLMSSTASESYINSADTLLDKFGDFVALLAEDDDNDNNREDEDEVELPSNTAAFEVEECVLSGRGRLTYSGDWCGDQPHGRGVLTLTVISGTSITLKPVVVGEFACGRFRPIV